MIFYCVHHLCTKTFDASIQSGTDHIKEIRAQGIQAGFTPVKIWGENIYEDFWYCPEHKEEGIERAKESKIQFDKDYNTTT